MREQNLTYELEDKDGCPNCHHQVSLWLGFSGVDNDGVHLAYRCPQCGFETCDYLPGVDDVVPNTIAWRREPDGVITWYSDKVGVDVASGEDKTIVVVIEKCSFYGCGELVCEADKESPDRMHFCQKHHDQLAQYVKENAIPKIIGFWVKANGAAKKIAETF